MKYYIADSQTKLIINELGEEYKDLLVERALENAEENDLSNLSISEIIKVDVKTKATLQIGKKVERKNQILSIISALGIVYSILGLLFMLMGELNKRVENDPMMIVSFLLISVGVIIAEFSFLFKLLIKSTPKRTTRKSGSALQYEIINKWKEIEALISEIAPDKDKMSLSRMLNYLCETKILTKDDEMTIRKVMGLRNQVVHSTPKSILPSQEDIQSVLRDADRVIWKMQKIL